ncbi:MAG: isoprenylcysteine carboxylmethyltransferase family protein [Candidatus Pacebacteria bacterium]|nr:isoprenylcysteine carboxylmethyltransferase family protein [Candidatus Paceibacterota bacterium]
MLLFGRPVLFIWSQRARHTLYVPVHERTCDHYDVGPYKVSRHPSYLGFFMMLFGFALLINAFVLFLVALVLVPVFTFIIIPKEEAMLIEVCGDAYREYRAKVRMWF